MKAAWIMRSSNSLHRVSAETLQLQFVHKCRCLSLILQTCPHDFLQKLNIHAHTSTFSWLSMVIHIYLRLHELCNPRTGEKCTSQNLTANRNFHQKRSQMCELLTSPTSRTIYNCIVSGKRDAIIAEFWTQKLGQKH